jgi:hypothetical protein
LYDFYIKNGLPFLWEDGGNVQFSETPSTEKFEMQEPINRWGFVVDGYTNGGLPYLQLLTPPVQFFEYVQGDYITVHDIATAQDDFNNNGLAILEPIRAIITEELDGIYDLELECYIDSLGKWRYLLENNIVKCNGQLFRIYKKVTSMQSRTVYCRHITFDLNDEIHVDTRQTTDILPSFEYMCNYIHDNFKFTNNVINNLTPYSFTISSDIDLKMIYRTTFVDCSLQTFTYVYDWLRNWISGQVDTAIHWHRDNFNITFNMIKPGTQQNAFNITHGVNMLDVNEEIDYTDFYSYVEGWDGAGTMFSIFYTSQTGSRVLHHHRPIKLSFSYKYVSRLEQDVRAFFEDHLPKVRYTVNFLDLQKAESYKQFSQLMNMNVGSSGKIYSEELGIETTQIIIKKVYDVVNDTTVSIDLGDSRSVFTRPYSYPNMVIDEATKKLIDDNRPVPPIILNIEKMTINYMQTFTIKELEEGI